MNGRTASSYPRSHISRLREVFVDVVGMYPQVQLVCGRNEYGESPQLGLSL
jgi:hypothetical protein